MNGWSFRAMGTTVRVLTDERATAFAVSSAGEAIRLTFEREERRFSRFRADSELSRVNSAAGRPIRVSPTFASVMRLALDSAAATDGLFDPTVLGALKAAGYDRDFDELLAGARGALHPATTSGRWRDVILEDDLLALPRGAGVDLGGLVKGWTADTAASRALGAGLPWVLVNAGGDLRIMGDAPPVSVAIEDPDDPSVELGRLMVREGGVATSSIRSRSWGAGLHHVIDPRTGAPSETDVIQVTVAASTCADAEVRAKAGLLRGSSAADGSAVTVSSGGHVFVSVPMEEAA
ncbi:MAG: FAD:protein FMN transferase [Actinomycetota bacterium]|nr:FAD:protein FMN transferase [Actinomycetota bacterium]